MITAENIHYFYKTYLDNLQTENLLEEYFSRSINKEEWVRRMRERAAKLRNLYNSNEELLNLYFYPILRHEEPLTDELVIAIAEELLPIMYSVTDHLIITEAAELIEPYAEEHGLMKEHIIAVFALGIIYQSLGIEEEISKAFKLYIKLDRYKNRVDEIPDSILKCFYTGLVWQAASLGNMESSSLSDILFYMKRNMDFLCTNERILNYIKPGDREAAVADLRNICLVALIAKMIRVFSNKGIEADIEEAFSIFEPIYLNNVEAAKSLSDVPIEYTFNYYKLRYLRGDYGFDVFLDNGLNFYNKVYNTPEASAGDKRKPFLQHNDTKLYLQYIPNLLEGYTKLIDNKEDFKESHKVLEGMVKNLIGFLPKVPMGCNDVSVCSLVTDSLNQALPIMDECDYDIFDIVYSYVIRRDMDVSIHSHMVAKIACLILESVYKHNPGLLVGCLNTRDVDEVYLRIDEIYEYIYKGALIHDLGKLSVSFITKKQSRKLDDHEFELIKMHPDKGAESASLHPVLAKYLPIIRGHHKTYSDKGYPENYSIYEHDNAILVNIVQLSDCLDAATDSLGRTYLKSKTSNEVIDEFIAGSNDRYNPYVVDIIAHDEELKDILLKFTTEGRIEMCYEIFEKYLDD